MMKRILVAVDGSEIGLAAVRAAAKLAAERGIPSVTLINVIPTVASTMGVTLMGVPPSDIEAWEVFAQPKAILAEAGVGYQLLLAIGDPSEEIIRAARDHGFDLVVVGHRGLSPVKAFLLGSVSNRIVSHAPCSVLVVRPNENNDS
jgi:nucleotide-binding universal stress UspA family protein